MPSKTTGDIKMRCESVYVYFIIFIIQTVPARSRFLVIPEDVATGSAAIYGFSPRLVKGNDHRVGFGFRFGNHADLQILYELGPQLLTKPLQPLRARSATYRERRRPFIELLLRAGFLREAGYDLHYNDNEWDEPR